MCTSSPTVGSRDRALDRVAGYSNVNIAAVIDDGLRRQLAAGLTKVRDLATGSGAVSSGATATLHPQQGHGRPRRGTNDPGLLHL